MKKLMFFIVSVPMLFFLAGCDEPQQPAGPDPVIEIAGGNVNLTVPAEGGQQTVSYTIQNPVDGGTVRAVPAADWINGLNYDTENQILFNVDPNEVSEARSQLLSIEYTYGEGLTVTAEVNVSQNAGVDYDYEWEMENFQSSWYGDEYGLNGEHSYHTWLSDKPFQDGLVEPGGTYFYFDLYGPAPDNENAPQIPAGTYTLASQTSSEATDEWTFSPDMSSAVRYNEEALEWEAAYSAGTLTVSYDGNGNAVMDAVLTDTEGMLHHLTYSGEAVCSDNRTVPPGAGMDIDFTATQASAVYLNGDSESGIMDVLFEFIDMEVDDEGYVIPPGTMLRVRAFMPWDENGRIEPGTYTISSDETIGSLSPGEELYTSIYSGTHARHFVSYEEYSVALATEGTMEVTDNGSGNYSIECDFTCADGYSLSCSWSGPLEVLGIPRPFSTLTGDYTLNLEGASATGVYYGDFYMTGGTNWYVYIKPTTGPDGLQLDFVSETVDMSEGIPTGTYTAAATDFPFPGEYLPGYAGMNLGGTVYMGGYTSDGYVTAYAPATSGNLNITNNGDGTYDITFSFLDDLGYTWDGQWSGEIPMTDYSSGASASQTTRTSHAVRETDSKKEAARVFSQNSFKITDKSAGKLPARRIVR